MTESAKPLPQTLPPTARRVVILANPRAGSSKSHRLVEDLVRALRCHGLMPALCWQLEELTEIAESPQREEVRCVVAAGGDGTLLEVVNRAPGLPAALLPLGNENLVAKHFGLERSGSRLAELIAAGHVRRIDLGRANGRLFCLLASAGFDAEVVRRVHDRRRGHIDRFSYVVPFLQAYQGYRFPAIDVEVLETGERLRGALVFVFNLPEYGLRLPIATDAKPDDGCLNLCVCQRPGRASLLRYLAAVAAGRHRVLPDFQTRLVRRIRLSAAGTVPAQTDGDPAGWLPLAVEVVPQALSLVAAGP